MLAVFVLIFIQILFGLNFITSKYVLEVIDPFSFTSFRFISAGIVLLFFGLAFDGSIKEIKLKTWGFIGLCTFFTVILGQSFFMFGIKYAGPVSASIYSITIPIFALLVSIARKQVKSNRYKVLGICGAVVGILIIKFNDIDAWNGPSGLGDLYLLLGCLSLSLSISYSKDLFALISAKLGTALIFLIGGTLLLPLGQEIGPITQRVLFSNPYFHCLLFSVLGGTLLTYLLTNWVIKKVDPFKLSIFIYLQPVITMFLAKLLFDENIGQVKILASLIIFSSVLLCLKETEKR